jgi:hypothetical protein
VIKAYDKVRHGFLWAGRKDANGGSMSIDVRVCRLLEFGGLESKMLSVLAWLYGSAGFGSAARILQVPGAVLEVQFSATEKDCASLPPSCA